MIYIAAAVLIAAIAGTGLVLFFLRRHAILDHPNDRSSHAIPVPRGGGIAVVAGIRHCLHNCHDRRRGSGRNLVDR